MKKVKLVTSKQNQLNQLKTNKMTIKYVNTMKKTITLTLAIFAGIFFLSSCSKKDEPKKQSALIGKWQIERRVDSGQEETLTDCVKKSTSYF